MSTLQYQIFLVFFTTSVLIFLVLEDNMGTRDGFLYTMLVAENVSATQDKCIIPSFEQVKKDLEYQKVFKKITHAKCQNIQPKLTYTENDFLKWNKSILNTVKSVIDCFANFLIRKKDSDDAIIFTEKFKIVIGSELKLSGKMVHIVCNISSKSDNRDNYFYRNIHMSHEANHNSVLISSKYLKDKDDSPPRSIVMILIESLSRVNAHIQLPKTINILKNLYNSTILNGI